MILELHIYPFSLFVDRFNRRRNWGARVQSNNSLFADKQFWFSGISFHCFSPIKSMQQTSFVTIEGNLEYFQVQVAYLIK